MVSWAAGVIRLSRQGLREPVAPISEPVIVKGSSGGFPIFSFSGNTLVIPGGYVQSTRPATIGTLIDLHSKIPALGVNFSLQ